MKASTSSALSGSSLRPRLASHGQSSTLVKTPGSAPVKEAKAEPLPPKELREKISQEVEATIVSTPGPLGQPTGAPSSMFDPVPSLVPSTKPIDLIKQIGELAGLGRLIIGNQTHLAAASLFTYMRQNLGFTIELTFPFNPNHLAEVPLGPLAVVLRYGNGWLGVEVPGWGKVEILPGEVQFQDVLAKSQGIEAKKYTVRSSEIIQLKTKLPAILLAFSDF